MGIVLVQREKSKGKGKGIGKGKFEGEGKGSALTYPGINRVQNAFINDNKP